MAVKCKFVLPPVANPKVLNASTAPKYITLVGFDHVNAGLCTSPKCVKAKWLLDNKVVKKHPTTGKLLPYYSAAFGW